MLFNSSTERQHADNAWQLTQYREVVVVLENYAFHAN